MAILDKVSIGGSTYDLADSKARASLAPVETATATAAHAVGELITIDGVLYRVIAAIAVGDTIKASGSSGVNVKTATVQTERDWVTHIATNAASGQIVFMPGRYRTDATVDLFNPGAAGTAATHCALVPCKAGDAFYSTVTTGGTAAYPWAVCAANGTLLYKAATTSATGKIRIYDTSAGVAAWIVFNWKKVDGDGKYAVRQVGGVVRITITDTEATVVAVEDGYYVAPSSTPLTSLSFTPSSTGLCEVRFTTGTTPTALTVPSGIKWPSWFNPSSLAASTTYDIMVKDGAFGAVMMWA